MKEEFIKELVDIKERLLQEKEYIENPNTFKLFFLVKDGLRKNVSLDSSKVVYQFQYNVENKDYLSLSKVDTTKGIVKALDENIDEILLLSLCANNGIEVLKNFVDSENTVVVYSFIVDTNYKNNIRVLK